VPGEHKGKSDAILVAEHPDYSLEVRDKTRIVRAAQVGLIERFPPDDGWYHADPEHDIPFGDAVSPSDPGARRLWRLDARAGPVARGYGGGNDKYDGRRDIVLNGRPSGPLGMAVEAF
jgi:hypothetical protein